MTWAGSKGVPLPQINLNSLSISETPQLENLFFDVNY